MNPFDETPPSNLVTDANRQWFVDRIKRNPNAGFPPPPPNPFATVECPECFERFTIFEEDVAEIEELPCPECYFLVSLEENLL